MGDNKERVAEYLEGYGFKLWATLSNTGSQWIHADNGINVKVDENNLEYEMLYVVRHSTIRVTTGHCGSLFHRNFQLNYKNMKNIVSCVNLFEEGRALEIGDTLLD